MKNSKIRCRRWRILCICACTLLAQTSSAADPATTGVVKRDGNPYIYGQLTHHFKIKSEGASNFSDSAAPRAYGQRRHLAIYDTAQINIYPQKTLIRGQYAPPRQGRFWRVITNPWVTAGLVTAAVAVPIAITNDSNSN